MSVWEEVSSRLNLVDVIGQYLSVKQVGSSYKVICPFHKDKNPSLVISPEKGLWHCFGCGAGGDIFSFVSQYENISKKETLQKLAKQAGVSLEKKSLQSESLEKVSITRFQLGLDYLKWVGDIYNKILGKVITDRQNPLTLYCLKRGLTAKIIQIFHLGYAPNNDLILNLSQKHKLNQEILLELGLLKKNPKTGKLSDKFKDRLMIPVFDKYGKIVGFTGRIINSAETQRPKYLNSNQSDWFKKSELWYGWHLNQKSILQQKKAFIVEGNMDVISAYRHGLDITLASQGTSFTLEQLQILKRLTSKIFLAFDNDVAGQISARKFFLEATQLGFEVNSLVIPKDFKDLDEYFEDLEKKGKKPLESIQTMPFLDLDLRNKNNDLRSSELARQKEALDSFLELLKVTDELTQEHYLLELSLLTKKSVSTLKTRFKKSANFTENRLSVSAKQPSISWEQNLNLTLQNFLAGFLEQANFDVQKLDESQKSLLQNILNLVTEIIQDFPQELDLNSYLNKNMEIFKLIRETQKTDFRELFISLKQQLNNHFQNFLDSESLSQSYLFIQQFGI